MITIISTILNFWGACVTIFCIGFTFYIFYQWIKDIFKFK